jgi:hypothetical protein
MNINVDIGEQFLRTVHILFPKHEHYSQRHVHLKKIENMNIFRIIEKSKKMQKETTNYVHQY